MFFRKFLSISLPCFRFISFLTKRYIIIFMINDNSDFANSLWKRFRLLNFFFTSEMKLKKNCNRNYLKDKGQIQINWFIKYIYKIYNNNFLKWSSKKKNYQTFNNNHPYIPRSMTTFTCHHQQVSRNEDTDLIYDRKRRTKKEDTYDRSPYRIFSCTKNTRWGHYFRE